MTQAVQDPPLYIAPPSIVLYKPTILFYILYIFTDVSRLIILNLYGLASKVFFGKPIGSSSVRTLKKL
jgi:hypothetical protein